MNEVCNFPVYGQRTDIQYTLFSVYNIKYSNVAFKMTYEMKVNSKKMERNAQQ